MYFTTIKATKHKIIVFWQGRRRKVERGRKGTTARCPSHSLSPSSNQWSQTCSCRTFLQTSCMKAQLLNRQSKRPCGCQRPASPPAPISQHAPYFEESPGNPQNSPNLQTTRTGDGRKLKGCGHTWQSEISEIVKPIWPLETNETISALPLSSHVPLGKLLLCSQRALKGYF